MSSSDGHRYYVLFLNDFTNFTWTCPISHKSQICNVIMAKNLIIMYCIIFVSHVTFIFYFFALTHPLKMAKLNVKYTPSIIFFELLSLTPLSLLRSGHMLSKRLHIFSTFFYLEFVIFSHLHNYFTIELLILIFVFLGAYAIFFFPHLLVTNYKLDLYLVYF